MYKKLTLSSITAILLATCAQAEELPTIEITSSLIKSTELETTYATEVFTQKDIKEANSKDIYDFLNAQSSISISPSYGNTFSQKIDMRGYGIGDGYQNVVITVNGRRLNNIDMSTQLLSSIPLESIERIEIIKGSGSVQFGDGANSGSINIVTKSKNQNFIKAYIGNNGVKSGTLSLGYGAEKFIINGFLEYTSTDGSRETTANEKDENYKRNRNINLIYFPTDSLELRVGRSFSNMNIKYGGSLSLAEYQSNPNLANSLTEQEFSSYITNAGVTYNFTDEYSIDINYNDEDKLSRYSSGSFESKYEYKSFNTKFNVKKSTYSLAVGVDGFYGDRIGSTDTTSKENRALFVSSEFNLNNKTKLSAGARREYVDYKYSPDTGSKLESDESLNAYELGVNYKINSNNSIFANYARSYQAPDIDRFFSSTWVNNGGVWTSTKSFNGFIEPAKVNTINLGYNNILKNNRLKVSLFYSDLKNEIYYYSVSSTSKNTNIDDSYKYGFEFFDKFNINENLYTSLNYSYIIAKVDSEDESSGAYDGKYLPGVSKHNLTLNLGYEYKNYLATLSHTYRSKAYAANDFENSFTQKQDAYNSTDVALSYSYKNFELFGKVQNIFDKSNALWIEDDSIYPVNFERTYNIGAKITF